MLRGCGLIEELSGFVCLASLVVVGNSWRNAVFQCTATYGTFVKR